MARKTKEEALETRDSILNAAVEVFYEHGVAASSLEQIAETAGVTRGGRLLALQKQAGHLHRPA